VSNDTLSNDTYIHGHVRRWVGGHVSSCSNVVEFGKGRGDVPALEHKKYGDGMSIAPHNH